MNAKLSNYTILTNLSPQFVEKIRMVSVFGTTGSEVLIVTNDDFVYAFGDNRKGCLGLGISSRILEPTKVVELCEKNIISFAFGLTHGIALTKSGHLYSWNDNSFGQLGNGTRIDSKRPILVNDLIGERIVEISCGAYHTMVLTTFGEVFCFGHNRFGQCGCNNDNESQLKPVKVTGFDSLKITAISCGRYFSMALTQNGNVFSWGKNEFGQLAIGHQHTKHECFPVKINIINNPVIQKIACGPYHGLFLSSDCDLYAFGANYCGQLGIGNKCSQSLPVKVNDETIKFTDIGLSIYSEISVSLALNGNCFISGRVDENDIIVLKEILNSSIDQVFGLYSDPKVTHKPICIEETLAEHRSLSISSDEQFSEYSSKLSQKPVDHMLESHPMLDCLSKSFDHPYDHDIKFKFKDRFIYAHKTILKIRNKSFWDQFQNDCANQTIVEIPITEYSYETFYIFIKYLYTNIAQFDSEEAIDLLNLANCFDEEDLKQKCVDIMMNSTTIENVSHLFSIAVKHNCKDLEDFCQKYIASNLNDVLKTDSFQQMDDKLLKNLMKSLAQTQAFSSTE